MDNPALLNDTMQAWLDHAYECLGETPLGAPKDRFLYHTRPPDDCCDYLALWLDVGRPTRGGLQTFAGPSRCGEEQRMARFKMKLVRPCWPVVRDNASNPFPPAAEMQKAAELLLIDGNVLWCCMDTGLSAEAWPDGDSGCNAYSIESLIPDAPRGGCAGWTLTFNAEIEGCC